MSNVNIKNLYDPVLYMLKRRDRKLYTGEGFYGVCKGGEKGANLIRKENSFLHMVEGDELFDHHLYYNDGDVLEFYISYNKKSGRVVKHRLIFGDNLMLERYEKEVINEGDNFNDALDSDDESVNEVLDYDL